MCRDGVVAPSVILASASPRRLDLLRGFGLAPSVVPADVDETPLPGEKPAELVERLARRKAAAVSDRLDPAAASETLVIAADTVIDLDGTVFGKPTDRLDAERMLRALSGRSHDVITGMAVVGPDRSLTETITPTEPSTRTPTRTEVTVARTAVWLRSLTADDIAWYLDTDEPMGKAGAYAIQGLGSVLVDRIEGSYQAVVGLSLPALDALTGRFGHPLRTLVEG
ncbi:MAG: Maf family protein [Actinomycetota bacterium]